MSTEPITGLTYQEPGSLQTDALQNAELNYFGAWLNCAVLTIGDAAPPGSPANGDCYIVGTGTGAWATHDDELAVYRDGWQFYAPKEGVAVKDLGSGDDYEFVAAAWTVKAGGGGGAVSSVNGASGAVVLGGESIAEPVTVLTPAAGVVNIDCALGDYFTLAPTANVTSITFSNLPAAGKAQTIMVRFTQDSSARTVAWPASFKWAGGVAGAVSTGSGAIDVIALTSFNQGTTWLATIAKAFA